MIHIEVSSSKMAVKKEQLDKFWVVGVPLNVFCDDPQLNLRSEFESLFRNYSEEVQFNYIKPLSRVLVTYSDEETCQRALEQLKNTEFCGSTLRVNPVKPVTIGQRKLSLPERTKQFLISPPASPPVGWEPISEDPPTVDYNLIAALSQLRKPGEKQEIITGSTNIPTIVITSDESSDIPRPRRIASMPAIDVQTRRPDYK